MTGTDGAASGAGFKLVQALRGIAAFWVVLFHSAEGHHVDALRAALPRWLAATVFDAGHFGVAIFFALSGFVIAHSLRDVQPTWVFLGRFALRRSIRLDPPYWLSMVVVVCFALLSARVQSQPLVLPSPGTVAAHLLYLQVLLQAPPINTVYWTLTYEVQFYLFLALTLVVARQLAQRGVSAAWPVAWTGMTVLAVAAALGWLRQLPAGLFPSFWATFFVGVLGYHAPRDRRAAAALAVLVAAMLLAPGTDTFARISAATAVLLSVALAANRIENGLNWRWLQFLGAISYSLYLLHNPITGAVGFLVRRGLSEGLGASIIALIAIIATSVAGAAAFWWTVERTSHRLSRRIGLPRTAPHRQVSQRDLATAS